MFRRDCRVDLNGTPGLEIGVAVAGSRCTSEIITLQNGNTSFGQFSLCESSSTRDVIVTT
jgi:hypothetical protein